MKKAVRRIFLVAFLALCTLCPAVGQEKPTASEAAPQYSLGDQTFTFNGGIFWPLFFLSYEPKTYPTNLSLGGVGTLQWQAYLTPNVRIGLEGGGAFAFSPNSNLLLMVPLTAKASYSFTIYPFEVPIFLGAGINLVKYSDKFAIDLLLKPGASLLWIFNSSWSFGLNAVYWWDMQFADIASESRIGNFLEFTLTALYHF